MNDIRPKKRDAEKIVSRILSERGRRNYDSIKWQRWLDSANVELPDGSTMEVK